MDAGFFAGALCFRFFAVTETAEVGEASEWRAAGTPTGIPIKTAISECWWTTAIDRVELRVRCLLPTVTCSHN
jgi:hypothetical protein